MVSKYKKKQPSIKNGTDNQDPFKLLQRLLQEHLEERFSNLTSKPLIPTNLTKAQKLASITKLIQCEQILKQQKPEEHYLKLLVILCLSTVYFS